MKTEMITTSVQEQLVTAGAFQISVLLTSDFQCVWTGGGQRTSGWCRGVVWEKSPGGVVAIDFRWKRATVRCVSILAEDVAEEYRWLGVHMDNRLSQRGLSRLCSLRNLRSKVLESLWSGRLTLCLHGCKLDTSDAVGERRWLSNNLLSIRHNPDHLLYHQGLIQDVCHTTHSNSLHYSLIFLLPFQILSSRLISLLPFHVL